jgi:type IV pilus assembly protein PilY1
LVAGSYKYVASFVQSEKEWSGELQGFQLLTSGAFDTVATWRGSVQLALASRRAVGGVVDGREVTGGGVDARQVITNDLDEDGMPVGRPFRVTSSGTAFESPLSRAYLGALTGTSASVTADEDVRQLYSGASKLVQYVRGSDEYEGVSFRQRLPLGLLGPIVSSSPWVQNPASSAKFSAADLPAGAPSYYEFVQGRRSRNKVVWVGSQDGMLHGFEAENGRALLSYVPGQVVTRLRRQADVSGRINLPLVDGAPFTADLIAGTIDGESAWSTYLFGSLGRGGKGLFALDVTNTGTSATAPGNLSEAQAASTFKWTFTNFDDSDLGYQLTSPVVHTKSGQATPVVLLNNRQFGLLVPNGYDSTSGRAALFILDVQGPTAEGWSGRYRKLVPMASDSGNGLMGVTWVDFDNNGTADLIYATDLRGRVWKFDVTSSNPSEWGSALMSGDTAVPLITALACPRSVVDAAQAAVSASTTFVNTCDQAASITTNPVVSRPSYGGVLVSFGTGRSIEAGDFPSEARTDRFVTVWDRGRYAEDRVFPPPTNVRDFVPPTLPSMVGSALSRFKKVELRLDAVGNAYRVEPDATGAWQPVPADVAPSAFLGDDSHDGWYLDFPSPSEQLIASPVPRSSVLVFTSIRPMTDADQESSCATTPRGRVWAFDPETGVTPRAFLGTTTITIGGEQVKTDIVGLDAPDTNVTIQQSRVKGEEGTPGVKVCGPGMVKGKIVGGKTDQDGCRPAPKARVQWRELPGMRTLSP